MMYQPIPRHMFHLRSYGLPHGRIWEKSSNGCNKRRTAGNEKHVEASECIQRLKSLVCLFVLHGYVTIVNSIDNHKLYLQR